MLLPDGQRARLRAGLTIGRGASCDVRLDDSSVSRLHAEIQRDGALWTISDRASRNGSTINGTRISPFAACPIRPGDQVMLGAVLLIADLSPAPDPDETVTLMVPDDAAGTPLSAYQLEVVRELARPWSSGGEPASNAAIAAALGTPNAVDAVKAALRRAYEKTGLSQQPTQIKRRELCRIATGRGWL